MYLDYIGGAQKMCCHQHSICMCYCSFNLWCCWILLRVVNDSVYLTSRSRAVKLN